MAGGSTPQDRGVAIDDVKPPASIVDDQDPPTLVEQRLGMALAAMDRSASRSNVRS
jgi:hypothetical protein